MDVVTVAGDEMHGSPLEEFFGRLARMPAATAEDRIRVHLDQDAAIDEVVEAGRIALNRRVALGMGENGPAAGNLELKHHVFDLVGPVAAERQFEQQVRGVIHHLELSANV